MIGRTAAALALALGLAGAAWAAPETSPRPLPRPEEAADAAAPEIVSRAPALPVALTALPPLRPLPRPEAAPAAAPVEPTAAPMRTAVIRLMRSPRPEKRPAAGPETVQLAAAAARTQPGPAVTTGRKGALCGDPAIEGVRIAPIAAKVKGCGLEDGVKVTAVDGVALSTPATIDCATATALRRWVSEGVKPAVGKRGGGVAKLQVAGHYACRPRNNQKGEKVSEHGRGRAIDIAAVVLRNGSAISVLKGWGDGEQGKVLRAMHRAACGPFGTVLGPAANSFHRDHFHFDTARYRKGAYCK